MAGIHLPNSALITGVQCGYRCMVGGSELSLHQRGPRDLPRPCQLISSELPTSSPRESHHDLASLGGIHSVSPLSILHIYPVASRGPGVRYVPSFLLSSSSGPPRSLSRLVPPLFHEILQILNFVPAHNSWAKTSPGRLLQAPLGLYHP